jgi:hypothetical protein
MRILIQASSDGFQWKLIGPEGHVARSEQRFSTYEDCLASVSALQVGLPQAQIINDSMTAIPEEAAHAPRPAIKQDGLMREAFEIVAMAAMQAGNDGVFLSRDNLAQRLLDSHLGPKLHARADQPGRDRGEPLDVAGNYVDWFSAHMTQGSALTAGWGRSLRRVRISAFSPKLRRSREIWAYSATPEKLRSEFVLRPDIDGRITLGVVGKDDSWTSLDAARQLDCGLYVVGFAKWGAILKELEELINDTSCTERMLQDFFEHNPTLLRGTDFTTVIPEAVIQRETNRSGVWEADFILAPKDQEEFCKIVELKHPRIPIVRNPNRGHARFSHNLHEAVRQLRDYASAFDSQKTREIFHERYGVKVFAPNMQLVIGRRWDGRVDEHMKRFQEENRVKVTSWDAELARLRRWLT